MPSFNGKAFRESVETLDTIHREMFRTHGAQNGRWALLEQIADEVMERLITPQEDASHGQQTANQ